MPLASYFTAKIAVAMAFALIVQLVLSILAVTLEPVQLSTAQWAALALATLGASIPFCALGLLVGTLTTASAAPAVANLIAMPMAICSGLWIPIDFLPDAMRQAADGAAALAMMAAARPDVMLSDIEMPNMTGLELAAEIRRVHAGVKVIVLTTFARPGYLRRALDAGVSGYLLKDSPASTLAEAVHVVQRGGRAIDPQLAAEAWGEADALTDRERQVLRMAVESSPSAEIAAALRLSEGTVRNYLSEAMSKLGAANRIEAARVARQKGWL